MVYKQYSIHVNYLFVSEVLNNDWENNIDTVNCDYSFGVFSDAWNVDSFIVRRPSLLCF